MTTAIYTGPSREQMLMNLGVLRERKIERMLDWSRKVGQLRALKQCAHLIEQEIKKEAKELEIIMDDLTDLGAC